MENKDNRLHSTLHLILYLYAGLDIIYNALILSFGETAKNFLYSLRLDKYFTDQFTCKIGMIIFMIIVAIGIKPKQEVNINVGKSIITPLTIGLLSLLCPILLLPIVKGQPFLGDFDIKQIAYSIFTIVGLIVLTIAIENVGKILKSNFGKDEWNIEAESFEQDNLCRNTQYSINIPTKYYYKKKFRQGYINIDPFRAIMVIGTPGSGKSFGIINPAIRQFVQKGFSICLYDFKFSDLSEIMYYHYLKGVESGKLKNYQFNVVNINDVEKSVRVNPISPKYITSMAQATETASALIHSLQKSDGKGGSEKFFTGSAINFIASIIFFFAKYKKGKYSTIPHVLAFINKSYDDIFGVLKRNTEVHALINPLLSAHEKGANDQLEGQIGTPRVFLAPLNSIESYWVFSGNDIDLKISNKENPSLLSLASNPDTQKATSALYSVIINRLLSQINSKGNNPCAVIADECPTIYLYEVNNLIATARSNKVSVLLGLQELPQFEIQYGKETASSIKAIIGTILSGSVRSKETLDWLQTLFGKKKQVGESLSINSQQTSQSLNEKLDYLIPAGKISNLSVGQMVGVVAKEVNKGGMTSFQPNFINATIDLDMNEIKKENEGIKQIKFPTFYDFGDKKEEILRQNYYKIIYEIDEICNGILNEDEKFLDETWIIPKFSNKSTF